MQMCKQYTTHATSDIPSSVPITFTAQYICNAPPQAPAATPHNALQILPIHNSGKNHPCMNGMVNTDGATISNVIPKSTIMSAKYFHRFTFLRKLCETYEVNRSEAAIPQPSRIKKFIVADNAVAPDRPTPTPCKMRWVANTERREVERS